MKLLIPPSVSLRAKQSFSRRRANDAASETGVGPSPSHSKVDDLLPVPPVAPPRKKASSFSRRRGSTVTEKGNYEKSSSETYDVQQRWLQDRMMAVEQKVVFSDSVSWPADRNARQRLREWHVDAALGARGDERSDPRLNPDLHSPCIKQNAVRFADRDCSHTDSGEETMSDDILEYDGPTRIHPKVASARMTRGDRRRTANISATSHEQNKLAIKFPIVRYRGFAPAERRVANIAATAAYVCKSTVRLLPVPQPWQVGKAAAIILVVALALLIPGISPSSPPIPPPRMCGLPCKLRQAVMTGKKVTANHLKGTTKFAWHHVRGHLHAAARLNPNGSPSAGLMACCETSSGRCRLLSDAAEHPPGLVCRQLRA